jgi:hypothetical protein
MLWQLAGRRRKVRVPTHAPGLAQQPRLRGGFASASRRHRVGIASASRRHRVGIASASRRLLVGIAPASRRLLVGFSSASRRLLVGLASASRRQRAGQTLAPPPFSWLDGPTVNSRTWYAASRMTESGFRTVVLDDFEILVGKSARDNDRLTFKVAGGRDLWLHAHGFAGSHVVVRHPDGTGEVPRNVVERAAELAAWHSKARGARGKVAVHVCRAADVSKQRGAPAGQVMLRRYDTVKVYPRERSES